MRSEPTALPQRVVVLGQTGSGKTTLAREIARIIDARHVELDSLYWDPGWIGADIDVFRDRVRAAVDAPRWVTDGGYARYVWDITWQNADTVVWLDYPWRLSFTRVFRRTIGRMISREELWNGNKESFRLTFFDRNSLLLFSIQNRTKYRATYPPYFERPELAHVRVHRFHRPAETEAYLDELRGIAHAKASVATDL